MYRSLSSLIHTADELLSLDVDALGGLLLTHLKSYDGVSSNSVYQNGLISQGNFLGMQNPTGYGQKPEYGDKQAEVNRALMEAWNWLEREGILIRDPKQPAPWFSISRRGEELLKQSARFEQWEKLGLDRVKSDLMNTGGIRDVGRPPEVRELAWKWVRMKENKPPAKPAVAGEWVLIADSRLDELRALASPDFDFRKLIRLCEELNIASREECHFAKAALTRALVDHVPPLFGKKSFGEVANNYAGTKSFREAIEHLDSAAKKVADGHLHTQIRKNETLPTAQQVNFASGLDVLLSEIVRITQ